MYVIKDAGFIDGDKQKGLKGFEHVAMKASDHVIEECKGNHGLSSSDVSQMKIVALRNT